MVKIEEKRNMAGVGRFERPIEDPKSSALPLGYTPVSFIIILEDTTEKQAGFSEILKNKENKWCGRPDLNRHGTEPKRF